MKQQVIAQMQGKNILVLGAGLTGLSCARFLQNHQLVATVNDSRQIVVGTEHFTSDFSLCKLVLGKWDIDAIKAADIVLVSPGIDLEAEQLGQHFKPSCQVMGDVELFCQINDKPIIAVTGSNGKSTVVSLLAHVASELGVKAALGGNVGTPVLDQLESDADIFIFELSSFQLETIESLSAAAATVLNVSDDHLDRHKTLAHYASLKRKIYNQATYCLFNGDDDLTQVAQEQKNSEAQIESFGLCAVKNTFGLLEHDGEKFLAHQQQPLIPIANLPLAGVHNALNYLAVLALGNAVSWPIEKMLNAFNTFDGLAHRCQRVPSRDGKVWINDSKATNTGATLAAINGLASADNQLLLIAGGDGKGADFSVLQRAFEQKISTLITLGKDGKQIAALKMGSVEVESIEQAVDVANQFSRTGDIILLSPACASIDMYKNFAERGERFTQAVLALQEAC